MKRCGMVCAVGVFVTVLGVFGGSVVGAENVAGDWRVVLDFDGREMASILSLRPGAEGDMGGKWISFFGANDLEDVKLEGDTLSCGWESRFGDQEFSTTLRVAFADGKLTGMLTGNWGEYEVRGERMRQMPAAVGAWDVTITFQGQDYAAKLVVSMDRAGQLSAEWRSEWGEHEISEVACYGQTLAFKRKSKVQGQEWESAFAGTVDGDTLAGKFTNEMGNSTVTGSREGMELVGRWELEVKSEFGTGEQILTVYPDMSGLYGPTPVEKIGMDGDKVKFAVGIEFDDQVMELEFAGQLEGGVLSGTMSGEMGSFELSGRKMIATNPKEMMGTSEQEEEFGEPDVIFVPTPQKVVDKMLEMAKVSNDDVLYDLGCGDGRIVVTAAKRYGCRAYGYDIDPERIRESQENVRSNNVGDLVTIQRKDIFTLDLSEADVVTLYLLPSLNVRLIPQLEKLRPGCRIVSHDFDMKGVKPDQVVEIEDSDDDYGDHTIYLWTTPLKKEYLMEE